MPVALKNPGSAASHKMLSPAKPTQRARMMLVMIAPSPKIRLYPRYFTVRQGRRARYGIKKQCECAFSAIRFGKILGNKKASSYGGRKQLTFCRIGRTTQIRTGDLCHVKNAT